MQRALAADQTESVEFHRTLQVDRLNAMLNAVCDDALEGKLAAVDSAVRIISAQSRLLGLVETGNRKRAKCKQPQTVVLMKDDCRLRECLDHT